MSLSEQQEKINKENYEKRLKSADKLLKIKDSVVMDKSREFYGVISSDKEQYYKVDPNFCDCIDFVMHIEHNTEFSCKHMIALNKVLSKNQKLKVMDLSDKLRRESL